MCLTQCYRTSPWEHTAPVVLEVNVSDGCQCTWVGEEASESLGTHSKLVQLEITTYSVVAMSSESDAWTHMQWRTSDSWSWKTNPELTVHNIEIELWSRTQCCFVIPNYWLHTCTRTKLHTNGIGFFCAAHKIPSFKIMQNLLLLIKIAINLKYLEPGIRQLCSREEQRERGRCRWSRLASLRSSHASACRTQSHFSVTFAESAQS